MSSIPVYQAFLPREARVCVWVKGNAIPSGSRVANQWEPVFVRVPSGRSAHRTGPAVSDVLIAGVNYRQRFAGAKPFAWTHWVHDLLGYRDGDQIDDLFAGSGAVTLAHSLYEVPAMHRCAVCGKGITQPARGRTRVTCSDACRRRRSRNHA